MSDTPKRKKKSKKRAKSKDEEGNLRSEHKRRKKKESKRRAEPDEAAVAAVGSAENDPSRSVDKPAAEPAEERNRNDEPRVSTPESDSEDENSVNEMEESSEDEKEANESPGAGRNSKGERNVGNYLKKKLHDQMIRHVTVMESDEEEERKIEELDIDINWEPPILHRRKGLSILTADDLKACKDEGVDVKKGKWLHAENVILAKNWENFVKEYNVKNPLTLLGLQKSRKKMTGKAIKFSMYLGKGLDNRPLLAIYMQARRMLDPKNYRGRFKKHEWKTLKQLVAKHGHKWTKIAKLMDRNGESLHDYYKMHNKAYNNGVWTVKEDRRLISALSSLTNNKDLSKIHHFLPWSDVSKLVRTRSPPQCSSHWKFMLSWVMCGKFTGNGERAWKREDNIKLLKTMRDSPFQTELDVPWHSMYEDFRCANCFQLKSKWNVLRMRVPRYYVKPFSEVVDWLVQNYLPILEDRMNKKLAKRKDKVQP